MYSLDVAAMKDIIYSSEIDRSSHTILIHHFSDC